MMFAAKTSAPAPPDPDAMTPADLRAARRKLGWTQAHLAQITGKKDARIVRMWEAGTVPIPPIAAKIVAGVAANASMRKTFAPAKKPKNRA
jgi:DNA-binding transcriptional regulator YiaG